MLRSRSLYGDDVTCHAKTRLVSGELRGDIVANADASSNMAQFVSEKFYLDQAFCGALW